MLTLGLRSHSPIPLEVACIAPDRLDGLSVDRIAALPVLHGNRNETLGDHFDIEGDPNDRVVRLLGDCSRVKWIGSRMADGRIEVEGDAGMHLGSGMSGGEILVNGRADHWAGAEMLGGLVRIRGGAGDLVGAAYRGGKHGMRGGTILIDGDAGDEVGASMRRGLIAVAGSCGRFAGTSMVAGSLFLFGPVGTGTGSGMKRGTIALFGPAPELPPSFAFDCEYRPDFLQLYLSELRRLGFTPADGVTPGPVRRFSGDRLSLGKGEVLTCGR